jgi:hypothetical protein
VNKWINSDVWVELIHQRYEIPEGLNFSTTDLNTIVTRNYPYKGYDIECTTVPNAIGIYKATKRAGTSGNKNTTAYLYTKPQTLPLAPGGNSIWYHTSVSLSSTQQQEDENNRDVPDDLVPTTQQTGRREEEKPFSVMVQVVSI